MLRSPRVALAVLLALAFAYQTVHNDLLQGFNEDKVYQSAIGQGWRDGYGLTVPAFDGKGGMGRAPVVGFPPGYSFLYTAAIGIWPEPYGAGFLLDELAAAVFFVAWFMLLDDLRSHTGDAACLIVAAYWAIVYSPLAALRSSDNLSLAFYSASIACAIRAGRERRSVAYSLGAGVTAAVAAAIRFPYWPLVAVPCVVVLVTARRLKVAHAALVAVPGAAAILVSALVNIRTAGRMTTVLRTERALYWRHLLDTSPFGAAPFGFNAAWNRLAESIHALAPAVPIALWAVTIGVFALCLTRWHREARTSPLEVRAFAIAAFLSFALTIVLISALGVVTPPQPDGWTITRDASRYLGPVFPFLFVPLAQVVTRRRRSGAAMALTIVLAACSASVVAYRAGQMRATFTRNREAYPSGPQTRAALARLHAAVRSGVVAGRPVVYCDPDVTREYFAIMSGAAAPRSGCSAEHLRAAQRAGALVLQRGDVPAS